MVRCPATRDVWLSNAIEKEKSCNMGAAPRIKLKIWQEFGIVDFDVSALKGRVIKEAWLVVKPAGGHKLGLNAGSDLRWLSVSTVSHDWVEGKSRRYAHDTAGHGATFLESSYRRRNWGWDGARVWDVVLGNGNSLRFDGELKPARGRLRIKLDPQLVRALVADASHGLFLMDGTTYVGVNSYIATRETRAGPFLEVTLAGADKTPPAAPANLKVVPAPRWATRTLGAIGVRLTAPRGAFAYDIRIDGSPLARWQVPFAAAAGKQQAFPVLDLPPGADVKVDVVAVDAAGNRSAWVSARGRTSPKLTVPRLPAYPFKPRGGDTKRLGAARVWAFPEVTKVSPVDGSLIAEQMRGDIRRANAVWDGATGTIRLAAARGEIVSFQVAVEGRVKGCSIRVTSLKGPGRIPDRGVRLWRNWYVNGRPEYAIRLRGAFDCPAADNDVAGQTLQAITVDYPIPPNAKAGEYRGSVTLAAGRKTLRLPLKVKAYDVVIPDEIHFNPELNCYGGPGRAGSEQFIDSFRLAHYHRCTINRVPYNQRGRVHDDWAPRIDAAGRVTDWTAFDRNLGGLLDGSWFTDNPRSGVPVPVLYLPLSEGWPKDFRKHYAPGPGVPVNSKDRVQKLRHDVLARPIDDALDDAFQTAWKNSARDFVRHATAKRWNRTLFECYLNNKPKYGYTMWTLDEPTKYLDWAALNFFAGMYKEAVDDPEVYTRRWHRDWFEKGLAGMKRDRPTFVFRGDISRLPWQGSVSDGQMNLMVLGGNIFGHPRLVRNARTRMPSLMVTYGSCNSPDRSNWESAAWCLKAYVHHADGVVPWQSLGGPDALRRGDKPGSGNALIINAGKHGHAVASFRVHALRRGAQDAELLRLLQLKRNWSREHIGLLVSQKVPLTTAFKQTFSDEAAAVTFGTLTGRGFCELKEGVLQLLTEED